MYQHELNHNPFGDPDSAPTILLVDDDPDCRLLVRDAILSQNAKACVLECGNGREALELLRTRCGDKHGATTPSLVFLDLEMPVLNGQQTLARIRSHPQLSGIPVVILTGLDDDGQERLALDNGANSYACKGQDAATLFDRVTNATAYWTRVHRPLGPGRCAA